MSSPWGIGGFGSLRVALQLLVLGTLVVGALLAVPFLGVMALAAPLREDTNDRVDLTP